MKSQKFGIEIEMTGITRQKAAEIISGYFGTHATYVGSHYSTYTAKDRIGRTWKCMSDASINCFRTVNGRKVSANREYSTEVVSPILTYGDIPDLQEIIRLLRKGGAFVNSSCGIHIHIDASRHTPATLRNLVNIMAQKEDILYKAIQVDPSRLNYCKKVNEHLVEMINRKAPETMEQLADMWYADTRDRRDAHYNDSRYRGLNLHATFTKGTIEFRLLSNGELRAEVLAN